MSFSPGYHSARDLRRRSTRARAVRGLAAVGSPCSVGSRPSSDDAERLRRIVDSAYDAFASVDAEGLITEWNPQAEATFGWSKDEIVGKLLVDTIIPEADRAAYRRRFAASFVAQDFKIRREVVAQHRDGHTFPVEVVGWAVQIGDALITNAFMRDISVRRQSEEALKTSERRLKEAAEMAKVGHWEWDVRKDTVTWTDQTFINFGLEPGEIMPSLQAFLDCVHPDDLESVKSAVFGAQPVPGRPIEFEHRTTWPDGSVRWLYGRNYFEFDEAGEPIRLFGVVQDVTARRAAEEAKAFLATVVESTADAIFTTDVTGRISTWNLGAASMFGYSKEEATGSSYSRLVPADLQEEVFVLRSAILRGDHLRDLRTARLHRDGTRLDVSMSSSPLLDDSANVIGTVAILRDTSASKSAEDALKRAFEQTQGTVSQLRELDRLRLSFVSSVSHELRTPLTSIIGFLELLEEESMTADQHQMLDVVDRNSKRLLHLIDDLLEIGKIDSGSFAVHLEPVDVGALIERATTSVLASVNVAGQVLAVEVEKDIGRVRGDVTQLERVLINLLSNSVKFTPCGGSIRLVVTRGNGDVTIAVSDTGTGIAEESLAQVFEPFYRSPSADSGAIQGTGLGLAIAGSIVKHHGGTITCESTEGAGTTMTVRIPAISEREIC